jgi:ubiquitin-conjugating enzyme E2 variant
MEVQMVYILFVILAILLADLIAGIFHWWEDRYGNPNWPIIGKYIIEPNINHHKHPRMFCEGSYLARNWTTLIPSLTLSACFYYYGLYFLSLVFLFVSQSNEIHCWEHTKTNRLIRLLQNWGILQDKKTHSLHHKRPYDTNYCIITMLVNPVLNYFMFWYCLEQSIYCLSGIKTRPERELY